MYGILLQNHLTHYLQVPEKEKNATNVAICIYGIGPPSQTYSLAFYFFF